MTELSITSREAAVILMAVLQRRGATFALNADGDLRCDLNGAQVSAKAEDLARIVLALATEIKQLLDEDRIVH